MRNFNVCPNKSFDIENPFIFFEFKNTQYIYMKANMNIFVLERN